MKFFIPCNATEEDSEGCWYAIREWLEERGLFTTERRIASLVCRVDGADRAIAVGQRTPYGDLAVAILESADFDDIYFVVTHMHGELRDPPYPMSLSEGWRVVEFE